MNKRTYYSVRTGKNENSTGFPLEILKRLVKSLYRILEKKGYFQERFGYFCVRTSKIYWAVSRLHIPINLEYATSASIYKVKMPLDRG